MSIESQNSKSVAGIGSTKHIIAIASGKGGVGKSTVAANLAMALAAAGSRVGLIDADLYGPSQPKIIGSRQAPTGKDGLIVPVEKHGVKFVSMGVMNPSGKALIIRAPLAIKAISQFLSGVIWGELDYLLIDMPPGTGDIQLTLAQQARLDGAVIISTPQEVAVEIARKGLEMFQTVNVPILGIIENMSGFLCSHCNETTDIFKKDGALKLATELKVPFMGKIPLHPHISGMSDDGGNLFTAEPDSPITKIFIDIAAKLKSELEKLTAGNDSIEPESYDIQNGLLHVQWRDGEVRNYDTFKLRLECPCANCVDEVTGAKIISSDKIPLNIQVKGLRPVGRYGLAIQFSDGHNTGIFKFEKLKSLSSSSNEVSFSV